MFWTWLKKVETPVVRETEIGRVLPAVRPKRRKYFVLGALVILLTGLYLGYKLGQLPNIPYVSTVGEWSVGIYTGDSLSVFQPAEGITNPVLTRHDITDVIAVFVADPFMVREKDSFYLFIEILNAMTNQGDIGVAVSSDALQWEYKQVVLDEPFHLSYPHVFKWNDEYYMIPESARAFGVRLYKAVEFPFKWEVVSTLIHDRLVDPTIFEHDGKWWLFACTNNYSTNLYFADTPLGPWTIHPQSPVVNHSFRRGRPGGRIAAFGDRIIRYVQDCHQTYGRQLKAFEITELTTTSFAQIELPNSPILRESGKGWNADGMHQLDPIQIGPNKWIAVVDGYNDHWIFGNYYY
ncbi:MAG: hypothetical protein AB1690_02685 [Candidatus Zixiibacteriota bacterium]|jgi:hypothetical protein